MVARIVTLIAALVVAVIGAGLVILYALQADERAAAQYTDVEVVVANRVIPVGTRLGDIAQVGTDDTTYLTLLDVPEAAVVPGAWQGTIPGDDRLDQVFVVEVQPGEQLIDAKLGDPQDATDRLGLAPPPPIDGEEQEEGRSAIVLSLPDSQRGSSWLQAGARVAVLLDEQSPPPGQEPRTCVLMPAMNVIAVGSRTDLAAAGVTQEPTAAPTDQPAVPDSFIALDVNQESALKITRAQSRGPLFFVLRPDEGGPDYREGCYTDGELNGELNVELR
jgi:pilus assembly protein CpaB